MVLDKLINPQLLHNKPYLAVPTGFFFVLLAFVSTAIVFPAEYSVIVVAFASMLTLPYVIKVFELDELNIDITELKGSGADLDREKLEKWVRKCLRDGYSPQQIRSSLIEDNLDKDVQILYDLGILDEINTKYLRESNFLGRHSKTVEFYCSLFLGMFLAFLALYLVLGDFREVLFKHQTNLIFGAPKGDFRTPSSLYYILFNNLKVMLLCVMLSLFYGSGAILILTYNASIAAVLYGGFAEKTIYGSALMAVTAYLPHTTIEILAYLLAAVSGGILSKSMAETEPGSGRLLLRDGLKFLTVSIILIIVSGVVEVTVPAALLT